MTDHGQAYDYPPAVALQIKDGNIEEYARAADFLNGGRFDVVCLQHEFGIFGGEAGAHILALLSRLTMPVVTTLHTVLAEPTAGATRGPGAHRRGVVEGRRDGQKGPRIAAQHLSGAGRQDRGHRPRHSRRALCRARCGQGQARIWRQVGHSDLRPAVAQQGHRSHDRRHAGDPETPRRMRSTSCWAQPIPIWCATKARPIAKA